MGYVPEISKVNDEISTQIKARFYSLRLSHVLLTCKLCILAFASNNIGEFLWNFCLGVFEGIWEDLRYGIFLGTKEFAQMWL